MRAEKRGIDKGEVKGHELEKKANYSNKVLTWFLRSIVC